MAETLRQKIMPCIRASHRPYWHTVIADDIGTIVYACDACSSVHPQNPAKKNPCENPAMTLLNAARAEAVLAFAQHQKSLFDGGDGVVDSERLAKWWLTSRGWLPEPKEGR